MVQIKRPSVYETLNRALIRGWETSFSKAGRLLFILRWYRVERIPCKSAKMNPRKYAFFQVSSHAAV